MDAAPPSERPSLAVRACNLERVLVAAALIPGLALGVALLTMETGQPITFAIALIDGLLKVAILASLPGLFLAWLLPPSAAARAVVLVAATGVATSFTLLSQRQPGPVHGAIEIWAAFGAVLDLLAASYVAWHCNGLLKPLAGGTLVAGVLALALPLAQFWHQTAWDSTIAKASLGLTPTAEVEGVGPSQLHVRVDLNLVNGGSGRVRIIHSAVDVCHWAADATPSYSADEMRDLGNCVRWTAFKPRSWLDANVGLVGSKIFEVPRADPHLVVLARVAYARGDRLQLSSTPDTELTTAPDEVAADGECDDAVFYRVRDDSHGRDLMQEDKFLGYADRRGHGGTAYFLISGDPNECRTSEPALIDYYGVTELSTFVEDWLDPDTQSPSRLSQHE